jgi:indolepyruvate ferredoxin oxidoreductase beta subunit
MSESIQQQVIISGVGGQGVLFVTRLLAEAVLSHLKVGNFSSPLIRPLQADILILLKAENLKQHGSFLKSAGWAVSNGTGNLENGSSQAVEIVDADALAQKIENAKAVNLVVLGNCFVRPKILKTS